MDDHNFWYWMLAQFQEFLLTYFLPFLPRHVDWDLANTLYTNAAPAFGLLFISVGSFLHLGTIFKVIQLLLLMALVQLFLAGRRMIARLIKLGATFGLSG